MTRRRGLTLLELLIAVFVLCVGILGLTAALPALAAGGGRVEATLEAADAGRTILDALRGAARERTHVVWAVEEGRRVPRSVYVLLPGAGAVATADPPGVFAERSCLLLPYGTDKVFTYPRAGSPAEVARKNGGGDATQAQESLEHEDVFALAPEAGADARGTSFAIRVQRARVDGHPRDGLYHVAVHVFRGQAPGELPAPGKQVATVVTELFAGPHDGLDVLPASASGAGTPVDPRDWLQAMQNERRERDERARQEAEEAERARRERRDQGWTGGGPAPDGGGVEGDGDGRDGADDRGGDDGRRDGGDDRDGGDRGGGDGGRERGGGR